MKNAKEYMNTNLIKMQLESRNLKPADVHRKLDFTAGSMGKYMSWRYLLTDERVEQLSNFFGVYKSSITIKPSIKMKQIHEKYKKKQKNYQIKADINRGRISKEEAAILSNDSETGLNNELFKELIDSNKEIIELDKHKIALLKQSIENQISMLNSLNELSTSLKSAESKVIIRIDDFQKHYDEISGKHQAFTVSSLKDIKRGINNGRI